MCISVSNTSQLEYITYAWFVFPDEKKSDTFLHPSCLWGKTLVKLPWQWTVWLWRSVMARPLVGHELVGCLTESTNVHQRCFLSESEHAQEHWEDWDLKVVGLHSKRASLTNISFVFVPQHTGVSGNECAYRLGEMAALRIRWAVDSAIIMNPLKETRTSKWISYMYNSAVLNRLKHF